MGDVVNRWWNGQWGRMGRRDVWLRRTARWRVEARQGGADEGTTQRWDFEDEASARDFVQTLLTTGGSGWRDITDISAGAEEGRTAIRRTEAS
jgi:hypothetical protein